MEVPLSWGATSGSEVSMVATAGGKRSEGHTLALKCFSLEGNHVTLFYRLLARTSCMALLDHMGVNVKKVDF